MSGNFHDANYNVTKIRTADGEVAELELNGKSVALASDVKIQDKKDHSPPMTQVVRLQFLSSTTY